MRTFVISILLTLTAVGSGCSSKVGQCNRLINAVNEHTDALSGAIESLSEIEEDPNVLTEFDNVIVRARDELEALELKDPTVAAFAEDYLALLDEAKKLGALLEDADPDPEHRESVIAIADRVVSMEDTLVHEVNAYCQAQ